ncbi:MAG: TIGR01459 family HAD-type hydrolase [Alphaproteobacteria bacterium]|nr:TIGR01459 family HAD-type hydrolase [Alphaproteobacteria bacterium]
MTSHLISIDGLGILAPRYDALICDVWGVVHNGVRAYAEACAALARFRSERGPVLMLSNAPRPAPSVAAQFKTLGVPDGTCDAILTSGDATRADLEHRASERPGLRLWHLGPPRDRPVLDGLAIASVGMDEAEAILCTGLFDDETETPADYHARLKDCAGRKLPFICANPDILVERGPRLIYCAGALARDYAAMGGEVTYWGKPHLPVYGMALARLAALAGRQIASSRILCIGDGLKTDIKGANAAGLDALLILEGVHAGDLGGGHDPVLIEAALAREHATARAYMPRLRW